MKLLQVELRNKETGISILYRHTGGLEKCGVQIKIPRKDSSDYDIRFYVMENGEAESESPAVIKSYADIEKMYSDNRDDDEQEDADEVKQLVNAFIKSGLTIDEEAVFPDFSYEDITEQELFGLLPMTANQLSDKEKGLWGWHGKRKLRFTLTERRAEQDESIDRLCYFDTCDNQKIERINCEVKRQHTDESNEVYDSFIDTNKFGDMISKSLQLNNFLGALEVKHSYSSQEGYTVTECFPINLVVKNTYYDPNKKLCIPLKETTHVSIDFGTSSTCIAMQLEEEAELLALSPVEAGIDESVSFNRFENPTNLMMFRWNKIYEEWIQAMEQEDMLPLFTKGTRNDENARTKEVHIDFGYSVKETLKDGQKKDIDTILTELKMIPSLLNGQDQLRITPYIGEGINTIYVVDSPEEQDKEHFDPIAFYGYLIGRAINNPAAGAIYVKYDVSYPVNFNKTIKEKIRHSLEYGIRMALPLPVRDAVCKNGKPLLEVSMKYSEPEAYIGALCGTYLQCDEKPSLFAVFDFGGGTLDFSFGIFRQLEDDEEVEIRFFKPGGREAFGGEHLISLLSFWILTENQDNKQQIIEKNIPFVVPTGEKKPGNFPESLFSKDRIAWANMRIVGEKFSRDIFEDKSPETDSINESAYLLSAKGDMEEVSLSVDYAALRDKLSLVIEDAVADFDAAMQLAFTQNSGVLAECGIEHFDVKDVNIFRSGNSSRSSLVQQSMENRFSGCAIHLIDETEGGQKDMRYAITPKTAVAHGQLKLPDIRIERCYSLFKWHIMTKNVSNGDFPLFFIQSEWQFYKKIRNGRCTIFYSDKPNTQSPYPYEYTVSGQFQDVDECFLYIRIADETSIECCVSEKKVASASDLKATDVEKITLRRNK